jgi:sulfotransferase family protein
MTLSHHGGRFTASPASPGPAVEDGHAFAGARAYCMFLGYPRSGHSLVGSLLDAHPHMVVAQELDALEFVGKGIERHRLFQMIVENSEEFSRAGRIWNGYAYRVPNQWHGRWRRLHVLGDKKGGRSSLRLDADPCLLDRLRNIVGLPLKVVHVIRNPFDNISTIRRHHGVDLDAAIAGYFDRVATVERVRAALATTEFHDLRHEDLIAEPVRALRELCAFLGEDAPDDYLRDCAGVVYRRPHRSRHEVAWSDAQRRRVADRLPGHPFLAGYAFDE